MMDRTKGPEMTYAICWLLVALVVSGCGKYKSNLTEQEFQQAMAKHKPVPKTTLQVSSEPLTVNEVVTKPVASSGYEPMSLTNMWSPSAQSNDSNTFKTIASRSIESTVDSSINSILLYRMAKKDSHEKIDEMLEKAGDSQWREFVMTHDGDEALAEEDLRSRGITRKEFKESRRREILSRFHVESKVPSDRPISHKEYLEYYNRIKDERYVKDPLLEFSLIDIQPAELKVEDLTESRQQKALALAREVYDKLQAGAAFEDMVKEYSQGVMARQAGRWSRNPASLAPPYDILAHVSDSLVPGEISVPIEAPGHVFIMKLHKKQTQGYVPMHDVQPELRDLILNERRMEAQQKLIQELETIIQNASEESIDEFVNRCAEEIYRRSNP
ncbi:MAG: peptidylprolyl isomerase [Phycisphaerae bacterium]|nr:peptidylprolyl isomerase [Phycisphaerae bacterium]